MSKPLSCICLRGCVKRETALTNHDCVAPVGPVIDVGKLTVLDNECKLAFSGYVDRTDRDGTRAARDERTRPKARAIRIDGKAHAPFSGGIVVDRRGRLKGTELSPQIVRDLTVTARPQSFRILPAADQKRSASRGLISGGRSCDGRAKVGRQPALGRLE